MDGSYLKGAGTTVDGGLVTTISVNVQEAASEAPSLQGYSGGVSIGNRLGWIGFHAESFDLTDGVATVRGHVMQGGAAVPASAAFARDAQGKAVVAWSVGDSKKGPSSFYTGGFVAW